MNKNNVEQGKKTQKDVKPTSDCWRTLSHPVYDTSCRSWRAGLTADTWYLWQKALKTVIWVYNWSPLNTALPSPAQIYFLDLPPLLSSCAGNTCPCVDPALESRTFCTVTEPVPPWLPAQSDFQYIERVFSDKLKRQNVWIENFQAGLSKGKDLTLL